MHRVRVTAVFLAAFVTLRAAPADLDGAFARFWSAKDPAAAAKVSTDIARSGASFDEVYKSLKRGRPYVSNVPTGSILSKRVAVAGEFEYVVEYRLVTTRPSDTRSGFSSTAA